ARRLPRLHHSGHRPRAGVLPAASIVRAAGWVPRRRSLTPTPTGNRVHAAQDLGNAMEALASLKPTTEAMAPRRSGRPKSLQRRSYAPAQRGDHGGSLLRVDSDAQRGPCPSQPRTSHHPCRSALLVPLTAVRAASVATFVARA